MVDQISIRLSNLNNLVLDFCQSSQITIWLESFVKEITIWTNKG